MEYGEGSRPLNQYDNPGYNGEPRRLRFESDIARLREFMSSDDSRYRVGEKLRQSTDTVIDILDTLTSKKTQLVFLGNSSPISKLFFFSRASTLSRHPKIAELLQHSIELTSDQNLDFRYNGSSPLVKDTAIIVDDHAHNLVKADQLLGGPRKNERKMVVFALYNPLSLRSSAGTFLYRYQGKQLFYGSMDNELANFVRTVATVTSDVADINGHWGVSHRRNEYKRYRWDRSKLYPEYEKTLLAAEAVLPTVKSFITSELSK